MMPDDLTPTAAGADAGLRILFLADNPAEAELAQQCLRQGGLSFTAQRVATRLDFVAALATFCPDAVIYSDIPPQFTCQEAARLCVQREPAPVFIMLVDAQEEAAGMACLNAGAADYVFKDRLNRLPFAVQAALRRRGADEALRNSETARIAAARWQFALDGAGDGVWDWNVQTNQVYYSRHWKAMLGYEEHEIGDTLDEWDQRLHPDDRARAYADLARCFDGRAPGYACEHRVRCKDGSYKWILDRGKVVSRAADGSPLRMVGTHTDITGRKQIEEALREGEQNFRAFFNTIDHLVFVLDGQGRIQMANDAVTRRLGYSNAELVGQSVLLVHPPERRDEAGRIVADMLAGKADYCPVPLLARDGRRIPVETRMVQGQWSGQKVIFGITKDLSELKASEEKFAKSFYASPALMAISDPATGRYLDVNEAFLRTLGYMRDEVVGHTTRELGVFAYPEQRVAALKALRERGYLRDYPVDVLTRPGDIRQGLFAAETLHLQDQTLLLTIMIDITDRVRAEDAVHRLNVDLERRVTERTAQLEASTQELNALAYSISHSLRAPLRAIDGFSSILAEEHGSRLDDEGRRLLGVIRANTQKMDQLIVNLLDVSRFVRADLHFERLNMAALVRAAYDEVAPPEVQREFSLSIAPLPDTYGDAAAITQVWLNLLSNAVKYTMPQSCRQIEVGCNIKDGMNVYYVKDSGVGFNPAYAHKLFVGLQRLHKAEEFQGVGTGLAIVKRIVQRHGGTVWAEGAIGQGATIYFSLPGGTT